VADVADKVVDVMAKEKAVGSSIWYNLDGILIH